MSVKHYRQPTAAERAASKKRAEKEAKMTPAQKKANRTRSTPAKVPVSKKTLRSAGASLRKAVNRKKK